MIKTNVGYNNCNDAFSSGKEKVYAEFDRNTAFELSVNALFEYMYSYVSSVVTETEKENKIAMFEHVVRVTSAFLSGGGEIFRKGYEILACENADIVGVMGTGIETLRTTYARLNGNVFKIKWEQGSQFAKWEYWLALTSALRAADGNPEKLLDKNFV